MKKFLITALLFATTLSFSSALEVGDLPPLEGDDSGGQQICYDFKNNMSMRNSSSYHNTDSATNGEVSRLQQFLHDEGYLMPTPTGYFGAKTLSAVIKFQRNFSSNPNGLVGPTTRAKIKATSCSPTNTETSSAPAEISSVTVNTYLKRITVQGANLGNIVQLKYVTQPEDGFVSSEGDTDSIFIKSPSQIVFSYNSATEQVLANGGSVWNISLVNYSGSTGASFVWRRDTTRTSSTNGTYLAYFDGNSTSFISPASVTESSAKYNCTVQHAKYPNNALRCTWNGKEVASYPAISNPPSVSLTLNGNTITNGTSITLPSSTATVTWGSTNASTCTFNGENIGTSGSKTLSGLTSSSHRYICTNAAGQTSTLFFSIVVPTTSVVDGGISAPIINEFSLDKTSLPSNESATLTYYFWAPGLNSEKAMACNILTYNKATGETQAGNTIVANTLETAGSFYGKRTYAGKDYPSGATISVECRNPAGSVSRSVDLKVVAPTLTNTGIPVPTNPVISVNGTTASTVTEGDNVTLSWSASNMTSDAKYYIYIDNVQKGPYAVTSVSASTASFGFTPGAHAIYLAACNGFTCSQRDSPTVSLTVNPRTVAQQPAPAITWVNASAQCSAWVGVPSPLITSGPNPIPSSYTVGTISYQYDSSNLSNLRSINTSSCSAPVYVAPVYVAPVYVAPIYVAPVYVAPVSVAPTQTVTVSFSPNSVIKNVTPLTISYSANFTTSDCSVYLDGAYFTSIAGSSYSWAVGPQDRPRTVMVTCAIPGGGAASSGAKTFTVTDVISSAATHSVLSTLGTSFHEAFNAVNTNIFEQGVGALSLLSGTTNASAATNSSKSCVNLPSNLHRGNETPTVSKLQSFLIDKGLLSEKASGFFGDLTIEAVKAYQRSVGLKQTGMVYGATREAILMETCK